MIEGFATYEIFKNKDNIEKNNSKFSVFPSKNESYSHVDMNIENIEFCFMGKIDPLKANPSSDSDPQTPSHHNEFPKPKAFLEGENAGFLSDNSDNED